MSIFVQWFYTTLLIDKFKQQQQQKNILEPKEPYVLG